MEEKLLLFFICDLARLQPFGALFASEPNILEIKLIGYSLESKYFFVHFGFQQKRKYTWI